MPKFNLIKSKGGKESILRASYNQYSLTCTPYSNQGIECLMEYTQKLKRKKPIKMNGNVSNPNRSYPPFIIKNSCIRLPPNHIHNNAMQATSQSTLPLRVCTNPLKEIYNIFVTPLGQTLSILAMLNSLFHTFKVPRQCKNR